MLKIFRRIFVLILVAIELATAVWLFVAPDSATEAVQLPGAYCLPLAVFLCLLATSGLYREFAFIRCRCWDAGYVSNYAEHWLQNQALTVVAFTKGSCWRSLSPTSWRILYDEYTQEGLGLPDYLNPKEALKIIRDFGEESTNPDGQTVYIWSREQMERLVLKRRCGDE